MKLKSSERHLKECQAAQGDEEKLFVAGPGGQQGPDWGPAWFPVLDKGQKMQTFLQLERNNGCDLFSSFQVLEKGQ